MFQFADPKYLYLIPFLIVAYFVFSIREKRKSLLFQSEFGKKMSPLITSTYSLGRNRWKIRLQILALVFLILSMARPQMGVGEKEVNSTGIELMLAVDVSTSMLAEDVKPSRLDFLKRELGLLLDKLSGDKVGLVVFAGSSALVSPLTTDYSALKMFIDGLSPESVSSQGTVFANAINDSLDAFKRGGIESDDDIRVSRVLLIASDGEDNEEGAIAAAKKAMDEGMFSFTLGFGTEKGGSIPIRDERGYLKGYKKDRGGNIILSRTKTTLLRKIAEAGGGRHYHAVVGGAHLDALSRDIDNLEKAKFSSSVAKDYNEYFQWPLFFAFLCLFLERILATRKSLSKAWKGRFSSGARV